MERFARLGSESNTVNDYWCAIRDSPMLQCLDIAAQSTLDGSLNFTAYDITSDSAYGNGELLWNVYETADVLTEQLYGQTSSCSDKRVGDGMINVYDIGTLLASYFGEYQYGSLYNMSYIRTVDGRDGLAQQCDTAQLRVDYLDAYNDDTCVYMTDPVASGRRLEGGDDGPGRLALDWWTSWGSSPAPEPVLPEYTGPLTRLPVAGDLTASGSRVANYSLTLIPSGYTSGRWYSLSTASIALALHVSFEGAPPANALLDLRAFDGSPPDNPTKRLVRYTRACEYRNQCDGSCAAITSPYQGSTAIVANTLELRQSPNLSPSDKACAFVVHVWIPVEADGTHPPFDVEYVSLSDGRTGQFARRVPRNTTTSASPPPIASPAASPPPPPDDGGSVAGGGTLGTWGVIVTTEALVSAASLAIIASRTMETRR